MSNHSSQNDFPLGATGNFPNGKLTESDEGEIQFAVGYKDDVVMVDFGKPVVWFGMGPDQADQLADLIKAKAQLVRQQEKK